MRLAFAHSLSLPESRDKSLLCDLCVLCALLPVAVCACASEHVSRSVILSTFVCVCVSSLQITVTKDDTIILHGGGDKADITERCEQIRQAISISTSDYDRYVCVCVCVCHHSTPVIRSRYGTHVTFSESTDCCAALRQWFMVGLAALRIYDTQ